MKTIRDIDIKNKKVIITTDLNVPHKDGVITDDYRIKKAVKTIKYAIDNNAKVIILSHLDRIKSEDDKVKNNSKILVAPLAEALGHPVTFVDATRGPLVEDAINNMDFGDVILLQNTRYEDWPDKKESGNDPELGKYWASLGDIFISDVYGTGHRKDASIVGIPLHLPSVIGFLMEEELQIMDKLANNPDRPYTVILGGAKVKDKIGAIKNLVNIADQILISGGISYTFLKAMGYEIGTSLLDEENIDFAKEMLEKHGDKLVIPVDFRVAKEFADTGDNHIVSFDEIKADEMGMDIGPKSIARIEDIIASSKTVIWNGAAGVFEFSNFENGTKAICNALAKNKEATTIIGGGDNALAAKKFGVFNEVSHVSTGGGATLMLLEGKMLPAVEVIK